MAPRHSSNTAQEPPQLCCDLCRKRKVKCDKKIPCTNCQKAGVDCQPNSRPRLPRGRHVAARRQKAETQGISRPERIEAYTTLTPSEGPLRNYDQTPDQGTPCSASVSSSPSLEESMYGGFGYSNQQTQLGYSYSQPEVNLDEAAEQAYTRPISSIEPVDREARTGQYYHRSQVEPSAQGFGFDPSQSAGSSIGHELPASSGFPQVPNTMAGLAYSGFSDLTGMPSYSSMDLSSLAGDGTGGVSMAQDYSLSMLDSYNGGSFNTESSAYYLPAYSPVMGFSPSNGDSLLFPASGQQYRNPRVLSSNTGSAATEETNQRHR